MLSNSFFRINSSLLISFGLITIITLSCLGSYGAIKYHPVLKCEGFTLDEGDTTWVPRQIVINNVYGSFSNLGKMLKRGVQNDSSSIVKWDAYELVISETPVKWNSMFATFSNHQVITADQEGTKLRLRVYNAEAINDYVPVTIDSSTVRYLGDHVFNNCYNP